jgi:putative copper resistance protein D
VENAWGLVRAVHYAACTGLFGLCLFRLYAPAQRWSRPWAFGLALTALVSAIAWYVVVTANLAERLDLSALAALAGETFGKVWIARCALAILVVLLTLLRRPPALVMAPASLALLASIALTGHTQTHAGWTGVGHMLSDAVHLTGAGVWLGGLIGLALALRPSALAARGQTVAADVARFSRAAQAAVAALLVTGLINAALLIGRASGLWTSQYGRQLLVKLALVAGMLALALVNRLVLTPRLVGPHGDRALANLRRNVLIEQALGIGVLLSVGWLGLSEPPA